MRAVILLATIAIAVGATQAQAAKPGLFGGTKGFVLTLSAPAAPLRHSVGVGSVRMIDHANELDSVGTYHVGKLDDGELGLIEQSLADTLAGVDWPSSADTAGDWKVRLVVRHYYTAHSNNDGGILASVAWALIDSAGALAFNDEFFVSIQKSDGGKTLGKVKELLNRAIVQRVAETSVALAASDEPSLMAPVAVEHTYATAEEAAAPMPTRLASFLGFGGASKKGMDWTEGAPTEPFDWQAELAAR